MEIPFQDILECVLRAALPYADFARAAAVSRQWQAVASENRPPSPKLMVPSVEAAFLAEYEKISSVCWLWRPREIEIESPPPTSSPAFLHVFGGKGASILPDNVDYPSGARFIGSFPGRWVALALDGWRGHCLFNIDSGERLPLPDFVRTPVVDVDSVLGIKSVALSAAPTAEGKFLIAAITSGATNIAFWRSGLDRWYPPTPVASEMHQMQLRDTRAILPRDPIEDIIYSRGRFLVLHGNEELVAYMEDDGGKALTMVATHYDFRSSDVTDRLVMARYLVEWQGRIFMIRHFDDPVRFEFLILVEKWMVQSDVRVAEWLRCADVGGRALVPLRDSSRYANLDGCALFLGQCCSRAVETGMPGRVVVHPSYNNGIWFYD